MTDLGPLNGKVAEEMEEAETLWKEPALSNNMLDRVQEAKSANYLALAR